MRELFTKKAKKVIGIAALTCFLATPVSYTMSISSAAAAALDNQTQFEQRHDPPGRGDRDNVKRPPRNDNDRKDNDKKRPAPPPKNNRDNDRWDRDKDKNPPPPRNDRNDRWDKDRDKNPPPPPPRRDRKDRDDDKDFDRGDITTAVLVGGVIGAIIAKNT